ncbi:hypothetical protein B5S28_g2582 [[Candida] boidinii]|nr:hypothetical protein B5S28_g2582 [[Candida] boidinii]OWB62454.1 hypothetical protein B5S29_g3383 [[Candida] boidinii]OWB73637.1 hypothetical protein B5S31_g3391 [[Candida] boidinii]OWB78835.1 hypothetical protein B5S32_g3039 [[Candida] boidinii]GMF02295.1 unnamed protein product [[Candida] boidinii]
MKLRIAAVQVNPRLGKIEENIKKFTKIIENGLTDKSINKSLKTPDILILPELALTGYNFASKKDIEPYLEIQGKGTTYNWAKEISSKYNCHTLIGYPEKKYFTETTNKGTSDFKIYNSAVLVNPQGEIIHNYRKTFLYETDETWGCSESPTGFETFDFNIKDKKIKTTIGICMDLNPYKFKAPFGAFEFGNHVVKTDARLVLVPTAWMNTDFKDTWTQEEIKAWNDFYDKDEPIEYNIDLNDKNEILYEKNEKENFIYKTNPMNHFKKQHADLSTGRYWLTRLNPLFTNNKPTSRLIAICNRTGMDKNLMYAGSSTIFRTNSGISSYDESYGGLIADFSLFGTMGQATEGLLIRDVELKDEDDEVV